MNKNIYRAYLAVAAIIVIGLGVRFFIKNRSPENVLDDLPQAPLLKVISAEDLLKKIKTSNKVSFVNIWATWCEPCTKELPDIMKLKQKFEARDLEIILVSVDKLSQRKNVHEFLRSRNILFPSYLRDKDPFVETLNPKWNGALPATMVFFANGQLADAWVGIAPLEKMVEVVDHAIFAE